MLTSDRSSRGRVGFRSRPGLPAGLSGLTGPALLPDWSKGRRRGKEGFGEGNARISLENDYIEYKYPHRHTPRCRLSGKLLDNTRIPLSFQTLRGFNNVVTETVAFAVWPTLRNYLPFTHTYVRVASASGAFRSASGTIDLASRVSVPKGSRRALSLSEPLHLYIRGGRGGGVC